MGALLGVVGDGAIPHDWQGFPDRGAVNGPIKATRVRWRRRKARADDFDPEGVEERLDERADVVDVQREVPSR